MALQLLLLLEKLPLLLQEYVPLLLQLPLFILDSLLLTPLLLLLGHPFQGVVLQLARFF